MPDLHQEFARARELKNLRVALIAVAAHPHVVFRIDEHAVLAVGPFIALSGTTPRLHDVPCWIEFDDGGAGTQQSPLPSAA